MLPFMKSGLVSITFRKLSAEQIVDLCRRAELIGIEWGGDVHVPPGDLPTAERVAALTRDAGRSVAAYGSYFRLGVQSVDEFGPVLDSASALGAPIIRVWAGKMGSASTDEPSWKRAIEEGRTIAQRAADRGIRIAAEWHGHTLTDTAAAARRLFDGIDHPHFGAYWQPHQRMGFDDCLADMDAALPRLLGVHVFHWDVQTVEKRPLAEGQQVWPAYLRKLAGANPGYALLEFVRNDDPEQLLDDARTLNGWLASAADARG